MADMFRTGDIFRPAPMSTPDEVFQKIEVSPDIVDYIRSRAKLDDEARRLLDEYWPEPETLADRGTITWTRRFSRGKLGATECVMPLGYRTMGDTFELPWPDIEGVDPKDLLNHGWEIRRFGDVPLHYQIAMGNKEISIYCDPKHDMAVVHWPSENLLVFTRPPEEEDD